MLLELRLDQVSQGAVDGELRGYVRSAIRDLAPAPETASAYFDRSSDPWEGHWMVDYNQALGGHVMVPVYPADSDVFLERMKLADEILLNVSFVGPYSGQRLSYSLSGLAPHARWCESV